MWGTPVWPSIRASPYSFLAPRRHRSLPGDAASGRRATAHLAHGRNPRPRHNCWGADTLSHLVRKADIQAIPTVFTISSVHRLIAALARARRASVGSGRYRRPQSVLTVHKVLCDSILFFLRPLRSHAHLAAAPHCPPANRIPAIASSASIDRYIHSIARFTTPL